MRFEIFGSEGVERCKIRIKWRRGGIGRAHLFVAPLPMKTLAFLAAIRSRLAPIAGKGGLFETDGAARHGEPRLSRFARSGCALGEDEEGVAVDPGPKRFDAGQGVDGYGLLCVSGWEKNFGTG